MKRYGRPQWVITDRLPFYGAVMKAVGNAQRQLCKGARINNRAENSHQPFRRRERAMLRFRSMKTLQKFTSVHAVTRNHFNHERHLTSRATYKQNRSAAMLKWGALLAWCRAPCHIRAQSQKAPVSLTTPVAGTAGQWPGTTIPRSGRIQPFSAPMGAPETRETSPVERNGSSRKNGSDDMAVSCICHTSLA
jgi:hypothetical protein